MADNTCFIIQPFEEPFNKRFTDIYKPAIEAAGLNAYRVDQDPSVDDIVKRIQDGIRDSVICLAEISVDNPNVFYELGAAHAQRKDVVMVCERGRRPSKFPFDIAGRAIIIYSAESPSDFEKLRVSITDRMVAVQKKGKDLQRIHDQPLAKVGDLESHELALLVVAVETDGEGSLWGYSADMLRAGYTKVATKLALTQLVKGGYLRAYEVEDRDGNTTAYAVDDHGLQWLQMNKDKIRLRKEEPSAAGDEPPF